MKIVAVILLVIGAVAAAPRDSKIMGGTTTSIEQYPSVVQQEVRIGSQWYSNCAGNIISNYYVLSVAHCTAYYTADNTRWRAGTSTFSSGGTVFSTSNVLNHPDYDAFTYDKDMSLIRLATSITYTDSIQSTAIPNQGYEGPTNSPVVIVGWGATESSSSSSTLSEVTVNLIDWDECKRRYDTRSGYIRGVVTTNNICAGVLDEGGKDSCTGDSGSPVYLANVLVGLVSWGEGCADPFYPGINTKISANTDWIVSNAV